MSLHQPAEKKSSFKSQRNTCFTIDSILDKLPSARPATDDEKSVTSLVVASDDEFASAADRDVSGSAPCSATERQQPDEEASQTRICHVDGDLERSGGRSAADAEAGQRRAAHCSSLLARTAADFHRRHQHRVAQLRSFSELFLAQYQQYQRQLRNHFRHHSTEQPIPPPSLAHSLPGLDFDCHRPPSDGLRPTWNDLQWSPVDHGSQLPTSTSTSVQHRTSRPTSSTVDWSAIDHQSQTGRFVDGSTEHNTTTPPTSTAPASAPNDNETHYEHNIADYSGDRNRRKWTSTNSIGIQTVFSLAFHTHMPGYTHKTLKNRCFGCRIN